MTAILSSRMVGIGSLMLRSGGSTIQRPLRRRFPEYPELWSMVDEHHSVHYSRGRDRRRAGRVRSGCAKPAAIRLRDGNREGIGCDHRHHVAVQSADCRRRRAGEDSLPPANPALAKDLNEIADKMREDLKPRFSELTDDVAKEYATNFTEPELKAILVFYQSPAGKKLLDRQPKIVDASMSFAQDWANKLSYEVVPKMREELKKRGYNP